MKPFALLLLIALLLLASCLPGEPIVAVSPANQSQVQGCAAIATEHNAFVWTDMAIGTAGASAGTAAASFAAGPAKTDLGIVAAGVAFLSALGAGAIALTGQAYANDHCSSVVGEPVDVDASLLDAPVDAPVVTDGGGAG
jgi:hypothetical protein